MKLPLPIIAAVVAAILFTLPACKKSEEIQDSAVQAAADEEQAPIADTPAPAQDAHADEQANADDGADNNDHRNGDAGSVLEQPEIKENEVNADKRNPSFQKIPSDADFETALFELTIQGKKVRAVTIPPVITNDEDMECANDACDTTIRFSDNTIAPAYVEMSLDLHLQNLGDLDGDGNDEIGCYPEWWTSVWHNYHFLTYKNGKWSDLVPGVTVNTEHFSEHPYTPIKKDPSKTGWYITQDAEMNDDGDIVLTENRVQAVQ